MNQHSTTKPQLKKPKTARGKRTRDKLLQAAEQEFGEHGFHEAAISRITERAGVALGSFYTYFESKEVLFRALVMHMSRLTRGWISQRVTGAPDRITAERQGLLAFIEFVREHKDLYRIVMEAQFVAPDAYRDYYETFAEAYRRNLATAASAGEISEGGDDVRAWALIGMSVFLGLRYGVWDDALPAEDITSSAGDLIEFGLRPAQRPPR
jgi:AcrR family transcriptional regulator